MVTEQASSAGGGGLLSPHSVAARVLVSTNVGVSSVISWWIAVTSMIVVLWTRDGRACSSIVSICLDS